MRKIPPFVIGQEVVCIENHSQGIVKKGQEFVVLGLKKFCCGWSVDIGLINKRRFGGIMECGVCHGRRKWVDDIYWLDASLFALKDQFKAISFTKVMETELTSVN